MLRKRHMEEPSGLLVQRSWRVGGGGTDPGLVCSYWHVLSHRTSPFLKNDWKPFGGYQLKGWIDLTEQFGSFSVYLFYQCSDAPVGVLHPPYNSLHRGSGLIAPESLQGCLWKENLDPHGQRKGLFAAIPLCLQGLQEQQAQTCLNFTKHQWMLLKIFLYSLWRKKK